MLTALYETTVRAATPLIESHLKKRAARGKEDPARAPERRGRPARARPEGPLVWFHAASVGKSLSLLAIIGKILGDDPALNIMVTTGTVTSAKLMAERLPQRAFHQYMPVDHPDWAGAFLDHWKPDLVVWAESDFWPAMLFAVGRRKIPAVLLNARMSESTFRKWQFAKPFMRHVLSAFDLCLAQNADEARRLEALGAKNVKVSANLKYAAAPLPFDQAKLDALKAAVGSRPLVLWASTHPGEEDIACRLHLALKQENPGLLTVIVPRHPARGRDLKASISAQGLNVSLRSEGAMPAAQNDVYLADTLGEMGLFYRLSKLAIVAGSFADVGGHNPIEPGQVGCVIFYGPMVYNFITICADFESRNAAVRVNDEADLRKNIKAYLAGPAAFAPMAEAAQAWTGAKSHIAGEVAADLAPYLRDLKKKGRVMMLTTPRFWYAQDTPVEKFLCRALAPLGKLYGWAERKRFDLHFPVPMEKPLLCVGNLTAGGAGKTPVALALADLLKDKGHNPHFLTRGYGGTEDGPLQVAPGRDTAFDVGDEALLLVEKAPTWVSRHRALGAQEAFDSGASIVILDDGFQNPLFHKDFSLLVVDGAAGFGNGHLLPAGPLREDISFGLSRAQAAVIVGEDKTGAAAKINRLAPELPVLKASLAPEPSNPDLQDKPVFAFAGIGRPKKFRQTLTEAGARVEGWKSFPDHFAYNEGDLAEFIKAAEAANAIIVTTAKDYVRLPLPLKSKVSVFRVRAAFEDAGELLRLIEDALGKRR